MKMKCYTLIELIITVAVVGFLARGELEIVTLEDGVNLKAAHIATELDYIIKGVHGEFYACKPDIFEKTYERV